jgi:hypothetical protein
MANLATTLFASLTTSQTGVPIVLPMASDKAKGCGYNGQTNGMHTVQVTTVNGFNGILDMQGTLVTDPQESDWFNIVNTTFGDGVLPLSDGTVTKNFTGNFVWVRAIITAFTAGDLNRVLFTHN